MECVYKIAVIAEIRERHCLGKFQRAEVALTVAVPLGRSVWMLRENLAPEFAVQVLWREHRGRCSPSLLPPAALLWLQQLHLTPSLPLLRARMTQEGERVLGLETWLLLVIPASEVTPG